MNKRMLTIVCALLLIAGAFSGCAHRTSAFQETEPETLVLDTGIRRIQVDSSWTLVGELTPTETGTYAIFATLSYNNSQPRGIAIVFYDGTYEQNLAVNEEYQSLSGITLQKLQTSCVWQITTIKPNMKIRAYARSSSLAGNDCQLVMRKLP